MQILIVSQGCDSTLVRLLKDVLRACRPDVVLVDCPTTAEARRLLGVESDIGLVIFNAMAVLMAANDLRQAFLGVPMVLLSGRSLQDVPTRREDLTLFLPILGRLNVVCEEGIKALLQLLNTPQ